jgi:hypothetical protein
MSWFGFGGEDNNKPKSSSGSGGEYDTSFPGDTQHNSGFSAADMGESRAPMSAGGMDPFQAQLMQLQQQQMAQAVIYKLTELAFNKCVAKVQCRARTFLPICIFLSRLSSNDYSPSPPLPCAAWKLPLRQREELH